MAKLFSAGSWKRLVFSNGDPFPSGSEAFFKFQKAEKGVVLYVTDLIRLWTATRTSREDICEQAVENECSIDPSEDEDQYNVFVSKLERGIAGQNSASVQIIHDGTPTGFLREFQIETSIPLPSALGTLDWKFSMSRRDAESVSNELLFPSLCSNYEGKRREDDLLRIIREKDHSLGKLLDKIESAGINLAMVFPGFAGTRKGLTAPQAVKIVPGLEPFKTGPWTEKCQKGGGDNFAEILDSLTDEKGGTLIWKNTENNGSKLKDQDAILDSGHVRSEHVNGRSVRQGSSSSSDSPGNNPPKPQKSKLGIIGRSRAKEAPRIEQHPLSRAGLPWSTQSPEKIQSHASPSRPTPSLAKPKFGVIGGNRGPPEQADTLRNRDSASASPSHSVSTVTASISSPSSTNRNIDGETDPELSDTGGDKEAEREIREEPPPTEAERANLKRKELRAQLQAKGAEKKKRKF